MPLKKCNQSGKPGWKWGDAGKCYTYTPDNKASEKAAKKKAIDQGIAIEGPDKFKKEAALDPNMSVAETLLPYLLTPDHYKGDNYFDPPSKYRDEKHPLDQADSEGVPKDPASDKLGDTPDEHTNNPSGPENRFLKEDDIGPATGY